MAGPGVALAGTSTGVAPLRSFDAVLRFATYDRLLQVVLFLVVLLTCGLTPIQTDTWWQLRAGKDMWESGSVLLSDQYSHTAFGAFWLNHEWLADVIFYVLYRAGGLALLTVFAAALIASGWMCTWRLSRGPARLIFITTLFALIPSAGWWEPRPHAFSLLFIPLLVLLLCRGRAGWVPPLFLLWANVHGGVLLGLVLLGAALGAQVLVKPTLWPRSLIVLLASAAAMTATPLGFHFWTEIPRSLSRISQYPLDEWARTPLLEPTMLPFWGIAIVYLVALGRYLPRRLRRLPPDEAVLHATALVLLPGAILAVRNVGPFLMIAVPALTYAWRAHNTGAEATSARHPAKPAFNLVVMILASLGVAVTLTSAYREQWRRLNWTPMPPAAIAALRECPGNLYNRYDEGGMLLWFTPRRVFLDGRQDPYPPALVLEHVQMETGRLHYRSTFDRHDIGCAFLPLLSPVASQLSADGWTSLYRDRQWVVFRK